MNEETNLLMDFKDLQLPTCKKCGYRPWILKVTTDFMQPKRTEGYCLQSHFYDPSLEAHLERPNEVVQPPQWLLYLLLLSFVFLKSWHLQ